MPEFTGPVTLGQALASHAAERPEQPALRFGDRVTSYAEYDRHATQIANGLAALGLRKGDRVAYLGKNSDHAVELFLGTVRGGFVFVPVIWRLAPAEVDFITRDAGAQVLFVEEAFESVPFAGRKIVMEREFAAWRDRQTDSSVETSVETGDPMLQLYTSGTTGMPKGVVLSHANATSMRPILRASGLQWARAEPGSTVILAMPYGHIAGVGTAGGAMLAAQQLIIHAEFDPAATIRDIREHRVEWIFLVPAAIRIVLSHPDAEYADFSSVKGLNYGASPIPLDLLKEGVERLKCDFAQMYGMTETYGTVVSLPPEDHRPGREKVMRSAGKVLPGNEVRIVDEQLQPLPPGAIGEVVVRGPTVMLGY